MIGLLKVALQLLDRFTLRHDFRMFQQFTQPEFIAFPIYHFLTMILHGVIIPPFIYSGTQPDEMLERYCSNPMTNGGYVYYYAMPLSIGTRLLWLRMDKQFGHHLCDREHPRQERSSTAFISFIVQTAIICAFSSLSHFSPIFGLYMPQHYSSCNRCIKITHLERIC